jgi:type I restriction enzyme S subunit
MFGDPWRNPKNWPRATLGDVIHSASDGPHVSPRYVEIGIPFLSTRHIRAGSIAWEDLKFIDESDAAYQWKKCRPRRGDLLYTKGGTTGLAAVVDTDRAFAVWVHVALLKPDYSKVDPWWLEAMLNTEYCYRQSQRYTRGIANHDLGLTRMTQIVLLLPPLAKQQMFVKAMEIVRKTRSSYEKSLLHLNTLFASLQHRAFRGEL